MATSMEGVPWCVYVAITLTILVASVVAVPFMNNWMVHKQRMTEMGFDREVAMEGMKVGFNKEVTVEGILSRL